jgi:hypothetical protein
MKEEEEEEQNGGFFWSSSSCVVGHNMTFYSFEYVDYMHADF